MKLIFLPFRRFFGTFLQSFEKILIRRSQDCFRYGDDDGGSRRDRYGRDREYDRHEDRRGDREKRRRTPDREFNDRGGDRYKRPRHDFDDSGEGGRGGGGYRGHGGYRGPQNGNREPYVPRHHQNNHSHFQNDEDILLSFKNWVMKQDDNINEDDACANYKVYKTEFKKKQMQEFFVAHKDEEWYVFYRHMMALFEVSASMFRNRIQIFNPLATWV